MVWAATRGKADTLVKSTLSVGDLPSDLKGVFSPTLPDWVPDLWPISPLELSGKAFFHPFPRIPSAEEIPFPAAASCGALTEVWPHVRSNHESLRMTWGTCCPPDAWPHPSSFRSSVLEAWAGGVRWRSQLPVAGQDSLAPPSPLAVASESCPLGGAYVFNSLPK